MAHIYKEQIIVVQRFAILMLITEVCIRIFWGKNALLTQA
jgi:hypothetical protein